jgi:hypothetical protein
MLDYDRDIVKDKFFILFFPFEVHEYEKNTHTIN